jgi:CDP-diglyceride synthetase
MLKQRIITALVLLALLLPALFATPPEPLALFTLILMAAASWEWGRLNGLGFRSALILTGICLSLCAASWWAGWAIQAPAAVWWTAGLLWLLGGAWMLRRGVLGWGLWPRGARWVGGILVLWLTWLALCQSKNLGVNYLLSVLALVWVADVAAYFGGRAFGRRKLASNISPGKSWEGVFRRHNPVSDTRPMTLKPVLKSFTGSSTQGRRSPSIRQHKKAGLRLTLSLTQERDSGQELSNSKASGRRSCSISESSCN